MTVLRACGLATVFAFFHAAIRRGVAQRRDKALPLEPSYTGYRGPRQRSHAQPEIPHRVHTPDDTSAALATVTGIVMGLLVGREAPAERAAKLQTILCPAHYPAFQACASELFRKIRVEVRDPFAPPAGHDPMAVCRKVAHQVKAQLPANTGFVLITFDYGDSGQLSYMSTADRADCIALLDLHLRSSVYIRTIYRNLKSINDTTTAE